MALTTALTNTTSVIIDSVALTEMSQLYVGGPSFAAFAGDTNPLLGDQWTMAVTNTMGAMVMWMERFFSMAAKGIRLPVAASGETVEDTLID